MEYKKERQFIYYWYKEFSWSSDPFKKAIPVHIESFIVGYDEQRKKLNYFIIEKQKICIIESDDGMGKTSIIRWIKHQLISYPKFNIISLDKSLDTKGIITTLISNFLSFKERLSLKTGLSKIVSDPNLKSILGFINNNLDLDFSKLFSFIESRMKNKYYILIIDDMDDLNPQCSELIQGLLYKGLCSQMILSGNIKSMDNLASKNKPVKIVLDSLDFDSCVEMIKKRIEGCNGKDTEPFSVDDLKIIYKKSSGNPSLFLDLSREKAIDLALNKIKFTKRSSENLEELKQHIDEQSKNIGTDKEKEHYQIKVISKPSHDIILEPIKKEKIIVDNIKLSKDKVNVKRIK